MANKTSDRPKRTRLTPEARREQILDAALIEFSAVGFKGATMDDIAQKVGITKAGLYAHFKGKDEIFNGLLVSNIFQRPMHAHWTWKENESIEQAIDHFLDAIYSGIKEPKVQATFRLLISESGRNPEQVNRWHETVVLPYAMQRQEELNSFIEKGGIPDNVFTRHFALMSAPALIGLLTLLFGGMNSRSEAELLNLRAVHREMLLVLLSNKAGK